MMTLFATVARGGGSLAALAAALALMAPAAPAAAQIVPAFQPEESPSAPAEVPRSPLRVERAEDFGGPARADFARPERPALRFERSEPRPEPAATLRPDRVAAPPAFAPPAPPTRIDPDIEAAAALGPGGRGGQRGERGGGWGGERRGGFGGEIRARPQVSEPAAPRVERSDDRERPAWRGGQVRGDGGWRGERAQGDWQRDRGDQTPVVRQDGWQQQQGRDGSAVIGGRDGWQGRRPDGWRGDRGDDVRRDGRFGSEQRDAARRARDGSAVVGGSEAWQGGRREDWRDGRRDGWRDGRRDDWRDGRRDDWRRDGWREGRRDGWRDGQRNWRRDDWRWGWNGRPGWDNRDFRRWDRGWRDSGRYDWSRYRSVNRFIFHPGPYFAPFRSHRYTRLSIGFTLDSLFFQPRFFINDPWAYRLPPAYGPYQWVRYYDDVLLVDIYTGQVVDVLYDFFW